MIEHKLLLIIQQLFLVLLTLLNFDVGLSGFDGISIIDHIPVDRDIYFSGWMRLSPVGFVKEGRKFIYDPVNKTVTVYDLDADPLELVGVELPQQEVEKIAEEIIAWRQNTIFRIDQQRTGRKMLFDYWLCRWTNRVCTAKYCEKEQ